MKLGLLAAPLVCGKSLYDGPAVGIGKCFVQCKFFLKTGSLILTTGLRFLFLTKISNFDFRPKFRFLTKISIFDQNFDFLIKIWILTEFGARVIAYFFRNTLHVHAPIYLNLNQQKSSGIFFQRYSREHFSHNENGGNKKHNLF